MGKIFHAFPETHAAVSEYCKERGLRMKMFVDDTLRIALAPPPSQPAPPKKPAPPSQPAPPKRPVNDKVTPVSRMEAKEPLPEHEEGPKPWEAPPFWAANKKEKPKTEDPVEEYASKDTVSAYPPVHSVSEMSILGGGWRR